jgi:hypothetical protein
MQLLPLPVKNKPDFKASVTVTLHKERVAPSFYKEFRRGSASLICRHWFANADSASGTVVVRKVTVSPGRS